MKNRVTKARKVINLVFLAVVDFLSHQFLIKNIQKNTNFPASPQGTSESSNQASFILKKFFSRKIFSDLLMCLFICQNFLSNHLHQNASFLPKNYCHRLLLQMTLRKLKCPIYLFAYLLMNLSKNNLHENTLHSSTNVSITASFTESIHIYN